MSAGPRAVRRVLLGFLWLSIFAILYTAGERLGVWPPWPAGAFRDWDLAIGAAGTAGLVAALAARRGGP